MDIIVEDIALQVPTVLNKRFQLNSVHYIGELGITYVGYDLIDEEEVIIKEFMPYRIANRDLDRKSVVCKGYGYKKQFYKYKMAFQNECECTHRLRKIKKPYAKCVTNYVDSFQENNTLYLVMDRVDGDALDECMANLSNEEKFSIIRDLIKTITQVHKKKILHCDIKPSNIMVKPDKRIALIDFGACCKKGMALNEAAYVSRGFSAPELYSKGEVSKATDIYSVGAVIYYLLTGYQLPQADDIDELDEIPALSEFVELSGFKEKAFMGMLDKDKRKRLRSVFLLNLTL